jgi:AcrR family transcriptional regulator
MSAKTSGSRKRRSKPDARSRRHHPDEARQIIIQRAYEFLWEHPFRDLTVAKLMAETTLSRPAFYQYFVDLHDLAESLLEEIQAVMHETANPWISGEGEPIAALRISLDGVVRTCVEHGPVLRAVADAAPLDERLEQAWSAFMKSWDSAVQARIKVHQRQGLIRDSLDAEHTARALNALDASVLLSEFGNRPQGDPDVVLETLHSIWVGTLYSQPRKRVQVPK